MFVWNNFTDNYLYIAIIINCIINLLYHYIIAKELFIIVQNKDLSLTEYQNLCIGQQQSSYFVKR